MAKQKPTPSPDQVFEEIAGLVDAFCHEHLNQEYADLCRRLTEKLARKRPSPLVNGKPITWACGIVRTIGWVNFLDDRTQKPHMKLTAIDKAFGVGESTGQGKSMLIRKMFKIRPMAPAWSLRSQMDENSLAWMIQINGFLVDARILKREVQEEALRKGLIPYIPERPRPAQDDDENEKEYQMPKSMLVRPTDPKYHVESNDGDFLKLSMRIFTFILLLLLAVPVRADEPKAHRGLPYAEPKNERQMLDVYATNHRFFPNVTVKEMTGDIAKAIRWVHDHAKEYCLGTGVTDAGTEKLLRALPKCTITP